MQIEYSYNPGSSSVSTSEIFPVGLTRVTLVNPFKSVASIYQTANETINYTSSTFYTIEREQLDGSPILDDTDPYYGTSKEYASLRMRNIEDVHKWNRFNN